ncbi:hypothetical protein H7H37_11610, partial [Mycolicibacterium insubricum]|nr:hypothetical protein [Mycolicibacterium insubricum]
SPPRSGTSPTPAPRPGGCATGTCWSTARPTPTSTAVGITHIQRGNPTGATSLLHRSAARLRTVGGAPYGVDAPGLAHYAEALATGLSAEPTPAADRLRPRLHSGELP